MLKKVFFWGMIVIGYTAPHLSFAATLENHNRKPISSCLDLSNQLKTLSSQPNIEENFVKKNEIRLPLVDSGVHTASSETFFTLHNQNNHSITLVKGPKDAKNSLIDFKKVKTIAKIQLPSSFEEIEILFFRDELLILSAVQYDQNQSPETFVLFYEIKGDKLSPVHYFKQGGKKIIREVINDKLYLITETPFSKTQAEAFIKKDGNLPALFPKLSEGISLGLKPSSEKTAKCQDFSYLFTPQQMPRIRSILATDLNTLRSAKEQLFLLGNFEQFRFTKDFLYAVSNWGNQNILVQRFALEPKINYQKSELLSGQLLAHGIFTEKTKSAFLTEHKSGKLKSYTITPFNERFIAQKNIELLSGNESYLQAQMLNSFLYLGNNQTLALVGKQTHQWEFQALSPQSLPKKNQNSFFLSLENHIVEIYENEGKLQILRWEKSKKTGSFQNTLTFDIGEYHLFGSPARNAENQLLLLPLQHQNFKGIRGLSLSLSGEIKPLFARNYPQAQSPIKNITQLPHFSYVVTQELIDLFLPQQPKIMKVLNHH